MLPESVLLTNRLAEVAPDRVEQYLAALRYHFALWRWQRISEPASLGFARRVLFETNLVELHPAAWIVNRGADEYGELLRFGDRDRELIRSALAGHASSRHPIRIYDSGSGNNTAAYELTRACVHVMGSGLSLVFAFDASLRNCLYEPFRSQSVAGYKSEIAGSALKRAEIWTVNRFFADGPKTAENNPIAILERALSNNSISGSVCSAVSTDTGEFLKQHQTSGAEGSALVSAVGLGFLIDALASRARFPNGMDFTYADFALAVDGFPVLLYYLNEPGNQTASSATLLACTDKLKDLESRIVKHLDDKSLSAESDVELVKVLPELADLVKAVGFELRKVDADQRLVETFHFVGNELWRWHFFLSDLASWNSTSADSRTAIEKVSIVRAWLNRPWGVLRTDDMKLALSFGFEEAADESWPPLIVAIQSLLRDGVDGLIKNELAGISNVDARIDWLVEQRCRLVDLRQNIKFVTYGDDDGLGHYRNLANLLIELLTVWFYDQPESKRQEMIKDELRSLQTLMRNGEWLNSATQVRLTRPQMKLLEEYRSNPNQIIDTLFDLSEGEGLWERADVFPLEEFWISPI
jgi:hypothetical protein